VRLYCLISTLGEVSGQLHAPAALLLEEWTQVSIDYDAQSVSEPAWMPWKREKCLSPAENRTLIPPSVSSYPSVYTNWAVVAAFGR
jgi:hypothetical protein